VEEGKHDESLLLFLELGKLSSSQKSEKLELGAGGTIWVRKVYVLSRENLAKTMAGPHLLFRTLPAISTVQ
jgi:hypothetical protein